MTPLQSLLSEKVGGLDGYVTSRRERGVSWRAIALEIRDDTGIDVTDEALRVWYSAPAEAAS